MTFYVPDDELKVTRKPPRPGRVEMLAMAMVPYHFAEDYVLYEEMIDDGPTTTEEEQG